jgi:hypothetical protein
VIPPRARFAAARQSGRVKVHPDSGTDAAGFPAVTGPGVAGRSLPSVRPPRTSSNGNLNGGGLVTVRRRPPRAVDGFLTSGAPSLTCFALGHSDETSR